MRYTYEYLNWVMFECISISLFFLWSNLQFGTHSLTLRSPLLKSRALNRSRPIFDYVYVAVENMTYFFSQYKANIFIASSIKTKFKNRAPWCWTVLNVLESEFNSLFELKTSSWIYYVSATWQSASGVRISE